MKISELYKILNEKIPTCLSMSWDNDGKMCVPIDSEITNIVVSLDVNEEVIDRAIEKGSNLIITHHPLIFKGIRSLTGDRPIERQVLKLVSNCISVFSFHTRLDALDGGVNDKLADVLGLVNVEKFGSDAYMLGRVGELTREMTLEEFAHVAKEKLGAPHIDFSGERDRLVKRIAVLGGSGGDEIGAAEQSGAQVYLTGELRYHDISLYNGSLSLMRAGHYFTEAPICEEICKMLSFILPETEAEAVYFNTVNSI